MKNRATPTAYLDNCIVSGLAREDLAPGEQQALHEVLLRHKEQQIKLMTSSVTKQEIGRVPPEFRKPHEVIYSLLEDVPTASFWVWDVLKSFLPWQFPFRQDPLYVELQQLLPDLDDAQHLFQAIKNDVDYFVTTDHQTILRYRNDLESTFGLKAVTPSQLLNLMPP